MQLTDFQLVTTKLVTPSFTGGLTRFQISGFRKVMRNTGCEMLTSGGRFGNVYAPALRSWDEETLKTLGSATGWEWEIGTKLHTLVASAARTE